MSDTKWGIHGNHTYYVTVKAENAAGLTTYGVSDPYIHNVQLPSKGIVMDVPVRNMVFKHSNFLTLMYIKINGT